MQQKTHPKDTSLRCVEELGGVKKIGGVKDTTLGGVKDTTLGKDEEIYKHILALYGATNVDNLMIEPDEHTHYAPYFAYQIGDDGKDRAVTRYSNKQMRDAERRISMIARDGGGIVVFGVHKEDGEYRIKPTNREHFSRRDWESKPLDVRFKEWVSYCQSLMKPTRADVKLTPHIIPARGKDDNIFLAVSISGSVEGEPVGVLHKGLNQVTFYKYDDDHNIVVASKKSLRDIEKPIS